MMKNMKGLKRKPDNRVAMVCRTTLMLDLRFGPAAFCSRQSRCAGISSIRPRSIMVL